MTRRIPSNLIVINQCHDDDCVCLDLAGFDQVSGEYVIRYWSPGTADRFIYSSFPEYMINWLDHWHSSGERNSPQSKP